MDVSRFTELIDHPSTVIAASFAGRDSDDKEGLYPLVKDAILAAAELLDLPERLRLILSQPKIEIIVIKI